MTFAALRLLAAAIGRLPPKWLGPLGAAVAWIAGSTLRIRRSLVEHAMTRAGVEDPRATARAMYRGLGLGLVELLWLAGARPRVRDALIARAAIDASVVEALERALTRGSVMVFASHTGNWELAAAAAARRLSMLGRRLFVVGKPMRARGVDAFLARLRASLGVHVIAPRGAFAAVQRALSRGDVVVMPIDQVPDRASHGLGVRFLGEAAFADRAPATCAWRAGASVLVVAAERGSERGEARHRVRLLGVLPPPPEGGRAGTWIDAATADATSWLEAFVARSPASWLWLHRRWRSPRLGRGERRAPSLVAAEKAS